MRQILHSLRTGATDVANVPAPSVQKRQVLIRTSRTQLNRCSKPCATIESSSPVSRGGIVRSTTLRARTCEQLRTIELRVNSVTAELTNASGYEAEGKNHILRRRRINRIRSYPLMYGTSAKQIAAGERGDSLRSVEVGSSLTLSLAGRLDALAGETGKNCG